MSECLVRQYTCVFSNEAVLNGMLSCQIQTYVVSLPLCWSVRRAAHKYRLREAVEGEDWTLFWTDCSVSLDRVMEMKRYQVPSLPWCTGLVSLVLTSLCTNVLASLALFDKLDLPSGDVVFLQLSLFPSELKPCLTPCRRSTISQAWVRSAGRTCWPGTWTACWSFSLKTTTSSPAPGASQLSE